MKLRPDLLPLLLFAALASCQAQQAASPAVQSMHHDKPPVPPSTSLSVTYAGKTTSFTVAELSALPQTTVQVHNAHSKADESYTGPLVADVLARAGFSLTPETEPVVLHAALIASATDGYVVVYSLAEAEPSFSRSQVIVALRRNGAPDTGGGDIQLINTDGAKPARWVHGLTHLSIQVVAELSK